MLNDIKHIIRYGTHAEKDFFLGEFGEGYYDAVMLNGNMVAYSIGAMSTFVLSLKTPFFIDPQTHVFQHPIEHLLGKNGEPKRSLSKLANYFGEPFITSLQNKTSLSPSILSADKTGRLHVIESVCKFQLFAISDKLSSQDEREYVDFAISDEDSHLSEKDLKPCAIIAPYFYLENDHYEDWLKVNIDFIKETKEFLNTNNYKLPLVVQIVVTKEVLRNKEKREKIIKEYSSVDASGVLLWVDALAEDESSQADLTLFKEVIGALRSSGKIVINLYGGYFSILLTKINNGLNGVCHGLEYGESRPVVPVGGGVPISKYYFRPVHKRIKHAELVRFLQKKGWGNNGIANPDFARDVCECLSCEDLAKYGEAKDGKPNKKGVSRAFPTVGAKEHSLRHYLDAKVDEFNNAATDDLLTILTTLKANQAEYTKSLGSDNVNHLERWVSVLK